MEPEVTAESLLKMAEETGDISTGGESPSIEDLLEMARKSGDMEKPDENPLFTADQYYAPPSLLQTMGITSIDEDDPIYRNLMTNPDFREAEPSERRRMFRIAVDDANQALYERQGTEADVGPIADVLGDGTNPRFQMGVDADGQEQKYVVPAPGSRGADMIFGETGGNVLRSITGGVMQAGRMIAGLPEAIADQVGDDEEDNAVNTTRQNFPLAPPENQYDAMGQEITSMIVGGIGGAGLVSNLSKVVGLTPKMAEWTSKALAKLKGKSPAEIADAARVMSQILIAGTGANLGASATTPEETKPLFGDEIVSSLGISPEDNRFLANFADNVAFSTGLTILGRLAVASGKGLKKIGKGALASNKNFRDRDIGLVILSGLDPNLVGAPAEIIAQRARIMGEVLINNKEFTSELLSNKAMPLDSLTALRAGVDEYVDRAYSFQKSLMGTKEWEKFRSDLAINIVSEMNSLRVSRASAPEIITKEGDMAAGMADALTGTADELAGAASDGLTRPGVDLAAEQLGRPVIDAVEDATEKLSGATATRDLVGQQLEVAASRNAVTDALLDARRGNALGSDQTMRALLEKLSGPDLYNSWQRSSSAYKDAFKNLPDDIPLPVEEFVSLVEASFPDPKMWPNLIDQVTLTETVEDPLKTLLALVTPKADAGTAGMKSSASPGTLTVETYEEMVQRLTDQGTSFKQVYTELRPALELRIRALRAQKLDTNAAPLIALKRGIDAIAEGIGDPAFIDAKTKYMEHAETFLNTQPLRAYDTAVKDVVENAPGPRTGVAKGLPDAYKAGLDALKQSVDEDFTPYAEAFIRALNQGADQSLNPELSEAYIGLAMNALSRSLEAGQTVTSRNIRNATQPFVDQIKRIRGGVYERWSSVVQDLEALEAGLITADQAVANLAQEKAGVLSNATKDVAAKFVFDLPGIPKIKDNPQSVFKQIYRSADSPDITRRLLEAAESQGNPMVRQGMQAAFIDDLASRLFTNKPMAISTKDTSENVMQVSQSQIIGILSDRSSPTLKTLNILFADDPDRAAQIVSMLEIQELIAGSKNLRGDLRGSSTAIDSKITYDKDLTKLMDRIITLRFGVLNTTATVTRNLVGALTAGYKGSVQEAAEQTIRFIAAEPLEFDRVLKLVAEGKDADAMQIMTYWASRGALGGAKVRESTDEQTREALPVE